MVTIRPPVAGDHADLARLLAELGYPASPAAIPARLARMLSEPGQAVLVAERDGRVVGLATLLIRHVLTDDAPFARLAALVVAADHQGQGIGRALVAEAERIARSAGCSLVEVTSGDHRPAAHAFYRALGFEERPRRFLKPLSPPG